MKYLLLMLSILTTTAAKGQRLSPADLDTLYQARKYREIVAAYGKSGMIFEADALTTVAAAYDQLHDFKAERKLLKSIVRSNSLLHIYDLPYQYGLFKNLIEAGGMQEIEALIKDIYSRTGITHFSLGCELLEMFGRDQLIRSQYDLIQPDSSSRDDSSRLARVKQEWEAIDQANRVRMQELIGKYGFPGKKLVGDIGANAAFMLIHHFRVEFREAYDPILKNAACNGDIQKEEYGLYSMVTKLLSHQIDDSSMQRTWDALSVFDCK